MTATNANPVEFDICNCLAELDETLDAYEYEVGLEERVELLEKAVLLSRELNSHFEASDHLFSQIREIKSLATKVFEAQINMLEQKS